MRRYCSQLELCCMEYVRLLRAVESESLPGKGSSASCTEVELSWVSTRHRESYSFAHGNLAEPLSGFGLVKTRSEGSFLLHSLPDTEAN